MVFRRPGIYKKEERSGTKAPQGQPDPGAFFMEILLLFLVHLTRNAYVAQKRHMTFANEFDDITRFKLILAKEFPDHAI